MNVLVTGGAGFIGSNFIRYWLAKHPGDKLAVLDKMTYAGNRANLAGLLEKVKFVQGDIADSALLAKTLDDQQVELIVNFAAETHVDRSIAGAAEFLQTNIMGVYTILETLKTRSHIRLHHVSTDEVFGDLPQDRPEVKFTENTPYNPSSPYSASKAAGDHLIRAYVRTFGVKATISNCSNNYGSYCYPEKLIPLVITRALFDQQIPIYGSGLQVRDWIHVDDHVRGIDLIIQRGSLGETYLLGGNGERTNLWIAEKLLQLLGKPQELLVHVGDRLGHDKRYAIDYSKAKADLGFEPEKSLEENLKQTVNWYQQNQAWWLPLKKNADAIAEKYLKLKYS